MKTTAIICEYNPFHKGHKLQLDMVKNRGRLAVCIMSGSFVQRGTPAVFDKYARAEAAVREGADLVLELPFPYCCSAAEHFAFGGVSLLNSLNLADELLFGSECGDINALQTVCDRLSSPDFKNKMKEERSNSANKGKSFAVLRSEVYEKLYQNTLPFTPNDILGIEYLSALKKLKSPIIPVTYKREEGFSATRSRQLLEDDSFEMIPPQAIQVFKNAIRYKEDYAERIILHHYRNADPAKLKEYEGMTDGIADKLVKEAQNSTSLNELMLNLSGKSYTNAKIRRCIIHGITEITPLSLKEPPAFTNVLACSKDGRALLKAIQKNTEFSIITKPAHYKKLDGVAKKQAETARKADSLLTLMCETPQKAHIFLTKTPFVAE